MDVMEYIAYESERQSATPAEQEGMWHAYNYMLTVDEITEDVLLECVRLINGQTYYRRYPAYFADGGHAINWMLIPKAMNRWVWGLKYVMFETGLINDDVDDFIKDFLDIHPFADGNGRVGSLLYNYLRGTLDNPEPMPYYFGNE